jgi:hypothetical protein
MAEMPGTSTSYAFRSLLFRRERRFTLTPGGLLVETGHRRLQIPYGDIVSAQLYQVDLSSVGPVDRCDLRTPTRTIRLQSAHVAGPAILQDRRPSYEPFVLQLLHDVGAANRDVRIMAGSPRSTRLGWMFTLAILVTAVLGGAALLLTGVWGALGLIVMGLGAGPRVLAMVRKKPSRLIAVSQVAASRNYCDLLLG